MARTIRHLSLHRIGRVELRVVADVEEGTLPILEAEETVLRQYVQRADWPHRWVTLFILQDMEPLIRQLTLGGSASSASRSPEGASTGEGASLPPGGAAALNYRPVVNVYDLANPAGCQVFVNRQAMVREGYWDDPLAVQGLFAHEHAHPLAENVVTSASRRLKLELTPHWGFGTSSTAPGNRQSRVIPLLAVLADKLCAYAPRELFANELAIQSGLDAALLHLDLRTMATAGRTVAGRVELQRQLQLEVTQGGLAKAAAELLLLIGDLRGYLDLALETAPFYRAGKEAAGRELETVLEAEIFPHLEPAAVDAYTALCRHYVSLRDDFTPRGLIKWGEGVLGILANSLAGKGLDLQYRLYLADSRAASSSQ